MHLKLILFIALLVGIQGMPIPIPIKAIYIDAGNVDYNNASVTVVEAIDAGFNLLILAFYLSATGVTDFAQVWGQLSAADQISTMNYAHSKGAYVMVSMGGATDLPYNLDPTKLGTEVGTWTVNNHLDGVDFDLENIDVLFVAPSLTSAQTVSWFATLTNAARAVLGPDRYISHAPQGPYFGPIGTPNNGLTYWAGPTGGYSGVYQQAPSIDFFLVQFYNQGTDCYMDYKGLYTSSCSNFPGTSIVEIAATGVPLSKIILGKPVATSDASNGYLDAATIHTLYLQGAAVGWNAGVFGWQWAETKTLSTWINTIFDGVKTITVEEQLANSNKAKGGLGAGAIAGIAVASLVVVLAIPIVIVVVLLKKKVIRLPLRARFAIQAFEDKFKSVVHLPQ